MVAAGIHNQLRELHRIRPQIHGFFQKTVFLFDFGSRHTSQTRAVSALFFREIAALDVPIEDLIARVLKQDVAFLELAKRRQCFVIADGEKLALSLGATLKFHSLVAI